MRSPLEVNRNANIDLIRGFAIILMVLDHALLAIATIFGSNEFIYLLRVTLTRFSMLNIELRTQPQTHIWLCLVSSMPCPMAWIEI